jgi:glycosyltransferase involved in cell wall biosynthesis
MAETPTIGLAIIARDEADDLPVLLDSAAGAFDQVALADTGSADGTPQVFTAWAEAADLPLGSEVESFPWCDDFAAARNFADSLLTTDWIAFADADDELRGADYLRGIVAGAADNVACFAFQYVGDRTPDPRVRVYRRGWTRWDGRAHEVPMLTRFAHIGFVSPEVAWVHRREDWTASDERDRRILADWLADEPDNPRALGLSAADLARQGERDAAADLLIRYLDTPTISAALGPKDLAASAAALDSFRYGETDDLAPVLFGGIGA